MNIDRIKGRLDFLREAERLKDVLRSAHTSSGRAESTAEHSWRLCLMAITFADELVGLDLLRVLKMCVVHDLGEAINGDIPAIEQGGHPDKGAQEREDLLTLTRTLDAGLRDEILALWDDYENAASPRRWRSRRWTSWRPCCSTTRAPTRRTSTTPSTSATGAATPAASPCSRPFASSWTQARGSAWKPRRASRALPGAPLEPHHICARHDTKTLTLERLPMGPWRRAGRPLGRRARCRSNAEARPRSPSGSYKAV